MEEGKCDKRALPPLPVYCSLPCSLQIICSIYVCCRDFQHTPSEEVCYLHFLQTFIGVIVHLRSCGLFIFIHVDHSVFHVDHSFGHSLFNVGHLFVQESSIGSYLFHGSHSLGYIHARCFALCQGVFHGHCFALLGSFSCGWIQSRDLTGQLSFCTSWSLWGLYHNHTMLDDIASEL